MASSGQEFLPSPSVCSSFAGSSSGAMGDFAGWREHRRESAPATASSASSLTTAAARFAARLLGGRLAQLELQPPAVVADLRFGPGFERPDLGQPRAQLHRDQPLARPSCRSGSRRSAARACAGRHRPAANSTTSPERVVGAGERAVQPERHRPVGHQLQALAIDFERGAFFGAARHQADGARLALRAARRCRCSRSGAGRRAPARRCRWSARRSSTPRPRATARSRSRFSKTSGRRPYQCSTTSATRLRRISGMKKPPLNRMASGRLRRRDSRNAAQVRA